LLIGGLLLLQGCSAIKLGYQQLPTLSYWWLDSTVSFSGNQTPVAKERLTSSTNGIAKKSCLAMLRCCNARPS
jgi:hypothetical protein